MKQSQRLSGISKFILVGLGVIIALLGLALAAGGVKLVSLGGSWYFLVGGLVMTVSGLLIARFKTTGAWLFAAFLVGTAIWAVSDAGLVFWPVFSRLFMFSAVGLAVLMALRVYWRWRWPWLRATCSSRTRLALLPALARA